MKKGKPTGHYKSVTVHLDEELAYQVEQTMISFGLDNKSQAAAALMRSGYGAIAGDAFLSSVLHDELKRFRDNESESLARHFEDRAKLFRSG